jgi:predicted ATPase
MILSLMSTIYQLAENVEQYAEIKELGRKRKIRRRSEQYIEIKSRNQKNKIRRRSEQYAEIKDRKEKRKLRVRSLSSCLIKKLTLLIISYYGCWSYE